jgi:hypothetical protein
MSTQFVNGHRRQPYSAPWMRRPRRNNFCLPTCLPVSYSSLCMCVRENKSHASVTHMQLIPRSWQLEQDGRCPDGVSIAMSFKLHLTLTPQSGQSSNQTPIRPTDAFGMHHMRSTVVWSSEAHLSNFRQAFLSHSDRPPSRCCAV